MGLDYLVQSPTDDTLIFGVDLAGAGNDYSVIQVFRREFGGVYELVWSERGKHEFKPDQMEWVKKKLLDFENRYAKP